MESEEQHHSGMNAPGNAAEARRGEEEWLHLALGALPDAMLIADAEGEIVVANRAAIELFDERPLRLADWRALHPDGSACEPEDLPLARSLLLGEVVRNQQLTLSSADLSGGVPVVVHSAPIRDHRGAVVGAIATVHDIPALSDFERRRDEFLASFTHDLKTPLTVIKGYARLLQRGMVPDSEQALAAIDAQVEAIRRLIDGLLDVARLRLGEELHLELEQVDLFELSVQLVEQHRATTEHHHLELIGPGRGAVVGYWDRARVEQIVDNLLSNAIKYSPGGGRVEMYLERQGEWARLQVSDQGLGIPSEALPRLFEPFYRGSLDSSQQRAIRGQGLGLFSAHRLAVRHGGRIEVASEQGTGSSFTLLLPIAGPATEPDTLRESVSPRRS